MYEIGQGLSMSGSILTHGQSERVLCVVARKLAVSFYVGNFAIDLI